MAERSGFWRAAAAVFTVINVGGAIYAVAGGEMMHASVHVLLLIGTFIWWKAPSNDARREEEVTSIPQLDSHLDHLQQSVDAIALEVERIGEAQRFVAKVIQKDTEQKLPE